MPKLIDLTGKAFGRLIVTKHAKNNKNQTHWECKCICGNTTIIAGNSLACGATKSCGCLRKETCRNQGFINSTHGMKGTPEYAAWLDMRNRCYRAKMICFKNYGDRGITVCDEWRHDFMAFYNHVGPRPSPEHSIDRINNNGNYEPENVRWATRREQKNNSRNNHKITLHGWTMNLCQWARFVNKSPQLICYRLRKGWVPTKAIFQPVRK